MTAAERTLAGKMIEIGRVTISPATLNAIDLDRLSRTLAGVIRCRSSKQITEQEALLYARIHWAFAALKVYIQGPRP